ncbi:MAG TPA: DMT family transporter [Baekduia sp.]|nr:DMT family transporter [Baekduia sp.]
MPPYLPSLLAVLCWGGMFPVADAATDHVDAAHITSIRYGVATLAFLALLVAVEGGRSLRYDGRFGRALLFGTLGFAGFNLLSYAGLRHTTPQHASLIAATLPVLTVLARWRTTGERPSPRLLGFVAAAFAGVALVVVGDDPAAALKGGIGDVLVLAGAVCWVRYTLSAASEFGDWSPLRFTALSAAAGTLSILAITAAGDVSGLLSPPSGGQLGDAGWGIVYVVVFGAVVAVLGWNAGVQRLGPANAALFMNLVPVTTFTIQAVRGATPGPVELIGAAVTLGALIGANASLRAPSAAASTPSFGSAQDAWPAAAREAA